MNNDDAKHDCIDANLAQAETLILKLEVENAKLRVESAWWAGEGQKDRPEIVEWKTLAAKINPTPIEAERLIQIARKIRAENETAPELLERVSQLEAENVKLREHNDDLSKTIRLQAKNYIKLKKELRAAKKKEIEGKI